MVEQGQHHKLELNPEEIRKEAAKLRDLFTNSSSISEFIRIHEGKPKYTNYNPDGWRLNVYGPDHLGLYRPIPLFGGETWSINEEEREWRIFSNRYYYSSRRSMNESEAVTTSTGQNPKIEVFFCRSNGSNNKYINTFAAVLEAKKIITKIPNFCTFEPYIP